MGQVVPMPKRDGLDDLAALGARYTPLRGKQPYRKAWPSKGVCNADTARQWLQKGENVGLITGKVSGVVVVDVDPRNGGDRSLYDLEEAHGKLPDTLTCQTGGGGLHLYFKWYPEAKAGTPAEGIDFKANGGCVVVPPSVHPDTGALYQWADLDVEVAELPKAWRQAMAGKSQTPGQGAFEDDGGPIPEGKRNTTLFSIARLRYTEGMGEAMVRRHLEDVNAERCQPPLPRDELACIVASAERYRLKAASYKTQYQEAVWRWPLDKYQRLFLQALASFADVNTGRCYPTQQQLAARACISVRKVRELSDTLGDAGWFERGRRARTDATGYNYSYRITIPEVPDDH